jgi:4-methyl-5(b-hydroxyethyl)-thiazole monophosphate biosynthesis
METETSKEAQATWKTEPVVIDGNLITSRGPGTASAFAYSILSQLNLDDKAQNLKKGMLF